MVPGCVTLESVDGVSSIIIDNNHHLLPDRIIGRVARRLLIGPPRPDHMRVLSFVIDSLTRGGNAMRLHTVAFISAEVSRFISGSAFKGMRRR